MHTVINKETNDSETGKTKNHLCKIHKKLISNCIKNNDSQPHLLPHRPQTLWSQPKDGGGHRAPQRALWVWSGWPSISQLSHQQLSLFISGGFTPTSAELKLSSYSCPVASTEASWQDPARAAPGASHCLSGGWVVQGGQA